ncbi:MAG: LPS export ABC transporter periplasmic protein LptC [Paludibacteraceae bacterium]|nr:LPS export ABC transporter periplasmic protein LptC [Paludibacteraceae bacterium]
MIVAIAGGLVLLAMVFSACHKSPPLAQSGETRERKELPSMVTDSVMTLISDSGVTRYRIEAPKWLIFDRTEPPCQEFPQGIYMEQFDEELKVQASLKADYAYYNETAQEWLLRGNVHALNRKGEQFDTPELRWSQHDHRVYSDTTIHITREKSIIQGVGFESNEEMSKYTILRPSGVFPIKDEEETESGEEQVNEEQPKEKAKTPTEKAKEKKESSKFKMSTDNL